MRRTDGAGECAVWRIWSTERPTASAAWAAEASCAPLHSMGFLMVAMMLLQRFAGKCLGRAVRGERRTAGHGKSVDLRKTIDLRQDVAEAVPSA